MSSEAILQQTLVQMLRTFYPNILISLSMSGVSLNGTAKQNAQTMQALSAQGFQKGLPDLVLYLPDGKLLNLELKKPNGGFQSQYQIVVESKLRELGHNYYLVHSTELVFDLLGTHTSHEFRLTQLDALNVPTTDTLSEQFLYWPKDRKVILVQRELNMIYRLSA